MPDEQAQASRVQPRRLATIARRIGVYVEAESMPASMVLAILVGLGTGLTAVAFIRAIGAVTQFSFSNGLPQILRFLGANWLVLVPILGALISGPMIAFWAIEAKGHGVPEVMQAIVMQRGHIRARVAVVKSLASTVCIGTGGSAGREGPIVQVGAALGSVAAQLTGIGQERTITLVACGAAAGIAATFNAPIAGVIFAMEVILGEFTTHYFGMVVVSAVSASIVSRAFLGSNPAFAVPSYALVSLWELPLYGLLGVLAALVGWAFVGLLYDLEDRFDGWRFPEALKPAVGAIPVGLIGLFYPQSFGTGLSTIERALKGDLPWMLLLVLIFAKLVSTSFTLGSGNSGGIFSPSLFMGAMLGGAFGSLANTWFPGLTASPGAYALVGMASVFAASAHAPLTAFLIVFEMSGDYRMILPLMVTVGLSTLLSQSLRRQSIYTLKLVKRAIPLERGRDVDVMRGVTVGEVMTQKPDLIRGSMSLRELTKAFTQTRHHGFPVLDDAGRLLGVVTIQDLERASSLGELEGRVVAEITHRKPVCVNPDDPLSKALIIMSQRGFGRIPVVAADDPTKLVGLLRRGDIIRAYRHAVLRKLEDQHRRDSARLGKLTNSEIVEVKLAAHMPVVAKRIRDIELPVQVLITSVRRDNRVIIPHGETVLEPGDVIVALAQRDAIPELRVALEGKG